MKDKVQKIREGVERLKSQLLKGACSSQVAMETRCKEEAYNEVLTLLDTIQEEPIIEDLDKAAKADAKIERSDDSEVWYDLNWYGGFIAGAEWRLAQMMKKAVGGHATFEFYGIDGKTYGTIAHDPISFDDLGLKDTDKCKLIIIKED